MKLSTSQQAVLAIGHTEPDGVNVQASETIPVDTSIQPVVSEVPCALVSVYVHSYQSGMDS